MKLNVHVSIFWAFDLTFVLKRSISFYRSNGTAEPDQSILMISRKLEPQGNCWPDKPFDIRITKLFINTFTTICLYSGMISQMVTLKRPKPEKGLGPSNNFPNKNETSKTKCPQKLRKNVFHLCQRHQN